MSETIKRAILQLGYKIIQSGNEITVFLKTEKLHYQVIVCINNRNKNVVVNQNNINNLKKKLSYMLNFQAQKEIRYLFMIWHGNKEDRIKDMLKDNVIDISDEGKISYYGIDSFYKSDVKKIEPYLNYESSIKIQMRHRSNKRFRDSVIITPVLIILIIAIYIRRNSFDKYAISWMALESGRYWNLIMYSLFHANFFHLLYNVISLMIIGSMLERRTSKKFIINLMIMGSIYTGLATAYIGKLSENITPTVGISGVIYAFMAALLIIQKNNKENYSWLIVLMGTSFIRGLLNVNTDNVVHLSGIIFGLLFAITAEMKKEETFIKADIKTLKAKIKLQNSN